MHLRQLACDFMENRAYASARDIAGCYKKCVLHRLKENGRSETLNYGLAKEENFFNFPHSPIFSIFFPHFFFIFFLNLGRPPEKTLATPLKENTDRTRAAFCPRDHNYERSHAKNDGVLKSYDALIACKYKLERKHLTLVQCASCYCARRLIDDLHDALRTYRA